MTVKKAIRIIDWWISQKKEAMDTMKKKWASSDDMYGIEETLLHVDKTIVANLETIRRELVPNCKHPKKMRDRTADGQSYCMNCNFDL